MNPEPRHPAPTNGRRPKDDRPAPIQRASGGQANADLAADCAPGDRRPGEDMHGRQEKLIDEAVEETFPASDSIAPKRIT